LLSATLAARMCSRAWHCRALVAELILAAIVIAGCGGGGSSPPSNGTTPGSYTITVYAFTESNAGDGSNANADTSVAIPLLVN
jgi:ABC-type glycerol-3-phosphate transport system substrate-binding protein